MLALVPSPSTCVAFTLILSLRSRYPALRGDLCFSRRPRKSRLPSPRTLPVMTRQPECGRYTGYNECAVHEYRRFPHHGILASLPACRSLHGPASARRPPGKVQVTGDAPSTLRVSRWRHYAHYIMYPLGAGSSRFRRNTASSTGGLRCHLPTISPPIPTPPQWRETIRHVLTYTLVCRLE